MGTAVAIVAAGCGDTARRAEPTTTATVAATEATPTSTTPPSTTVTSTTSPSTTSPFTTTAAAAPTTTVLRSNACDEVAVNDVPLPATYAETAFDRFGPLDPAPSLTIKFGHDQTGGPVGVRATRIEGGVLISASKSPTLPSKPGDRLPIVAVNHDGTVRWSRCLDGNRDLETVVAASEHRPANALVHVLTANEPDYESRFVQVSLATGAEQPAFAAAMQSVGVTADALARLRVAGFTDRYALFADDDAVLGGTYEHIVHYDLVADVAVDVGVPAELLQEPTSVPCGGGLQLSLSDSGDVVLTAITTDPIPRAVDSIATGAVVARWHAGAWTRQPPALTAAFGVRPDFACDDNLSARVLRGVDALGQVRWTDADLTHPGADDIGWYVDGSVAVGPVCAHRVGEDCDRVEFVGLDPNTGRVRWTQPGLRLVAGDPADGYALVWAEATGDTLEPAGWVLLDDRTGRPVPGQSWDDPELFTLYPSREVAGFNRTVRAGGLVLVVKDDRVQVWYPRGAGGEPRTVLLP
jgi:hypothetical protein